MDNRDLFNQIFQHSSLKDNPPVLLDLGASGALHDQWVDIAKYSICIAFDADEREMDFIDEKAKDFRQLHIVNKVVTASDIDKAGFYLTSSPFCSSMLHPDNDSLADWAFAHLFKVERQIELPAVELQKALSGLGITQVDWFKADTQGLDLDLFKNLGELQNSVLVADLEPGFIDAYKGEDKIKDMLAYMDGMPFWLCQFIIGGNQRMNIDKLQTALSETEIISIRNNTATSAIFGGATYVNDHKQPIMHNNRAYLLGCVFALVLKQYGFAAELALSGKALTGDALFDTILEHIKKVTGKVGFKTLLLNPPILKRKVINTLIRKLNQLR